MEVESPKKYNQRAEKSIAAFQDKGDTVAIIGKGRSLEEQSLVLVEKGSYIGFGFLEREVAIADFESAKNFVRKSVETRTVKNLINSYITNPRGGQVMVF